MLHIRKITIEDLTAVHYLVQELADYERASDAVITTVEEYERDYKAGLFDGHVAVDAEGQILGMTFFYMAYSTWKGRMLYLEDFVVKEAARGNGAGQLLFDAFIEEARRLNCTLVKWQVLDWNEPALRFYARQNALIENEWLNGKIFLKLRIEN